MKYDEFGEVINAPETYKGIAEELKDNAVLVGWTDEMSTHFDILFTLNALPYGTNIQGGIRPRRDLFVSIMRWGAFAFEVADRDLHPGYLDEKLSVRGPMGQATSGKLAELINGVKKELLV